MSEPPTPVTHADDPEEGQTMAATDDTGTLDAAEDDPTTRMDPHPHPHGGAPDANPLGSG